MTSLPSAGTSLDPACAAVEDRLPWLVNGTLGAAESHDVERHVAACPRCRASLEAERNLAKLIAAPRDNVDVAPHAAWRALESRLDGIAQHTSSERARSDVAGMADAAGIAPAPAASGSPATPPAHGRGRGRRVRSALVWIVAAQAAAIAGLTLLLWRIATPPDDAGFRTLSSPPDVAVPAGVAIRIAVERTATPGDVRGLADGIAARVAAGPDDRGIATLVLPPDAAGSADSAVQWLRAQPAVLLAERVYQESREPAVRESLVKEPAAPAAQPPAAQPPATHPSAAHPPATHPPAMHP